MSGFFGQFDYFVRYIFAAVAVIILLRCVFSLFRSRPRREAMATLVNLADDSEIVIENWETSIGRSRACDISLKDYTTVSRFHAVLALRKGGWYIFDTDSKTGVYVNGKQISHAAVLKDGDTVSFGNAVMKFKSNGYGTGAQKQSRSKKEPDYTNATRLVNLKDKSAYYLSGSCLIGRDKNCNICLPVDTVSKEHAEIYLTRDGWMVADLNSHNGTFLNGDMVFDAFPLYDGDIIEIASYRFMFRE